VEAATITSPYKSVSYTAKRQKYPQKYPQIDLGDSIAGFRPTLSFLWHPGQGVLEDGIDHPRVGDNRQLGQRRLHDEVAPAGVAVDMGRFRGVLAQYRSVCSGLVQLCAAQAQRIADHRGRAQAHRQRRDHRRQQPAGEGEQHAGGQRHAQGVVDKRETEVGFYPVSTDS